MGYYTYHMQKFLKQQVKWMLLLAVGMVLLLVPPEAWFPGEDFIPNFWRQRALLFVLVEYPQAWVYLGILVLVGWVVVQMIEVVK